MPQDRPKSIFGGFGALLEAPWEDVRGTDPVPDLDQDPDPETDSDQFQIQLQILIQR